MLTGDQGVMNTNDDATVCKRYAVSLGYWKDPFIDLFFHNKHPSRSERKTPEINRGYYARVQAINYLVDQFLSYVDALNDEEGGGEDAGEHQSTTAANEPNNSEQRRTKKSGAIKCQIVNVGAGFDTLFWRLKADKKIDSVHSFVDLDLDGVTYRKLHQIRIQPDLLKALGEDISFNKYDLHSNTYHLISGDLRNTASLDEKLAKDCKLDKRLPTLFISECVLVYLAKQHTANFLRWASGSFDQALVVNYEQVNMEDKFGQIMMDNLRMRDCEIMDLESCRSLESQQEKFLNCGFSEANAWTMQEIYTTCLNQVDKERIERIEFLDEANLLEQLLNHYSITVAYKGFKSNSSVDEEDETIFGFV